MKTNAETLVLVFDKDMYFFPYVKSKEFDLYSVERKSNNACFRAIRSLCRKCNIPLALFFDNWSKKIAAYKRIIVFDNAYKEWAIKYIKSKNKNAEKYVFCWNAVREGDVDLNRFDRDMFKIYSFDKANCKEHQLNFAPTVYTFDTPKLSESMIKQDILFVGTDKGRINQLKQIKEKLDEAGIRSRFIIVGSENGLKNGIEYVNEYISYENYLKLIAESAAILDMNSQGQVGLSMRVSEANFLDKKLITTNSDVVNYDFYNPGNIFVFNENECTEEMVYELKDFLKKPYEKVAISVLKHYDMATWINNFN